VPNCAASAANVLVHGRFFKLLPFRYSVIMSATEQDGVITLSGSQFLGRMFGTFTFSSQRQRL
jgi:hypothetical protein